MMTFGFKRIFYLKIEDKNACFLVLFLDVENQRFDSQCVISRNATSDPGLKGRRYNRP